MKRWMKIAAAVIVLLIIVFAALFFLVNANTFRPMLETQLSTALGRQVKLGNLQFAPFSGSLVASDLSIAGDPAYGAMPFLTARQLRIGVEMGPLIFSRQLKVRSFQAEEPQIHLVRGANGSWNFSSIGRSALGGTRDINAGSAFSDLTAGLIAIRDGSAVVESLPPQGPARVYNHLNLSVRQFSLTKRFPFTLSASLPAGGEVSVTGNVGPINQQDAAMTAYDAQISVKHLDPVAAGFLDPNIGVSLLANIDAHAVSDGQTLNSSGTVHMDRLQLRKTGSPAPKAVDLVYNVTQNLKDNTGQLKSADVNIGNVAIHLSGVYRLIPDNPWLNVKVSGQNLPIDELQALMTAAGVTLPNGSVLKGGTLTIALTATGPASNLVINGPVAADNTSLVGFDLGSKISGIAALGGIKTGDITAIQKLRLNLLATNAGLKTDHIYALMPAVGEATGSGTVAPSGALNYRLLVRVKTAHGLGKAGAGLLAKLNGTNDKAQNGIGIPMLVHGTANDPVITADVGGVMRKNSPGKMFRRLFGKKK